MMKVLIMDDEAAAGRLKFLLESESGSRTGANGGKERAIVEADCRANSERVWKELRDNPFYYDALMVNYELDTFKEGVLLDRFRELRRMDPYILIFLSTSSHYLPVKLLEFGYEGLITKPYDREKIRRLLARMTAERACADGQEGLLFPVFRGDGRYRISTVDVLYGQKVRNGTRLVTRDGEYFYRMGMDEIERRSYRCFCRCHNSFIVNIRYIRKIENGGFLMENGEYISITRTYRQRVREYLEECGLREDVRRGQRTLAQMDRTAEEGREYMAGYGV